MTAEYTAIKKSGFKATLEKDGMKEKLNFKHSGFMEISDQAVFHPIKFAEALATAAESNGVKFFTDSEVIAIEDLTIKTKTGLVVAKDIVIATYSPLTNQGTHFRKALYMSYVYELEIAKDLIPEGLYLDSENPYHYFRVDKYKNFDRMIIGGEDHRKDIKIDPKKNFNALEKYSQNLIGDHTYKINHAWSGEILESIDGLPLIGAIKPHLFVATAFSGNGMTYAPTAATIIRDAILNRKNPYSALFTVQRTSRLKQLTAKGIDYMKEFFGGALKNLFLPKR